jgi:hypothetical protein
LKDLDLQFRDDQKDEWCLTDRAKRIGTRTALRKADGTAAAYLRWKEEVLEELRTKIESTISGNNMV